MTALIQPKAIKENRLSPILKWAGGKEQDKDFFNVVNEIIHNWELLEKIVEKNKDSFIKIYLDFSQEKMSEQEVDNWLSSFVLLHSQEFNGMFSTSFNVYSV